MMRTVAIFGVLALFLIDAGGAAQAAGWCAGQNCTFRSYGQCQRAVGNARACHRQAAARAMPRETIPPYGAAPAVAPPRPAWASPYECYYDEGYGRYRACNAGGSVH